MNCAGKRGSLVMVMNAAVSLKQSDKSGEDDLRKFNV